LRGTDFGRGSGLGLQLLLRGVYDVRLSSVRWELLMHFTEGQVLWSLEDTARTQGGYDLNGEWVSSGFQVVDTRWSVWTVERVTARGAWVQKGRADDTIRGKRMWVGVHTKKVAETKERALDNARSKRAYHVIMCRKRLDTAELRLRALERLKLEET
jgi:hypothetical protein